MTIASILAVVEGDAGSAALLAAAFALARRSDAYLEALHVRLDPRNAIPLVGEGVTGAVVEQIMNDARQRGDTLAAEARRLFEAQCAAADLPPLSAEAHAPARGRAAWRLVEGRPEAELAARAPLFDLIAAARPAAEDEGGYAPALEAALFEGGAPLLLVPPGFGGRFGERVAIGWNGRREAAHAVAAALPLLARAKAVTVLSLEEEGRGADPRALAERLALHHIEAEARRLPAGAAAGEALLGAAQALEADLLVTGAYGHSRLRQLVLGGVTRSLLSASPIPLLMAH